MKLIHNNQTHGSSVHHKSRGHHVLAREEFFYSNFAEIILTGQSTPTTIIRKFKKTFARYGIPKILMTDNGPKFTAE